jgi:hypothetical protein
MRNRVFAMLTSWVFVSSLAVLLINDHVLKQAYPGFVTGKLSDFAGIAVVALPLFAAFPRRTLAIYLAIVAAFLWWKSPASSAFISFMNEASPLNIGRTVDYRDLLALAILPLCSRYAASRPRGIASEDVLRRWVLPPVIAATLFGVMATSLPPQPRKDFNVRTIESAGYFPQDAIAKTIKEVALAHGLKPREPNPPLWAGAYQGRGVFMTYNFKGPNEVAVSIQAQTGMFGDGEVRRAEKLRAEIKKKLGLRFSGLESVEPLHSR